MMAATTKPPTVMVIPKDQRMKRSMRCSMDSKRLSKRESDYKRCGRLLGRWVRESHL